MESSDTWTTVVRTILQTTDSVGRWMMIVIELRLVLLLRPVCWLLSN